MSRFWRVAFRVQYRVLAWIDPLVRAFWRRFGLGNIIELRVQRRRGGKRSRLLGLLRVSEGMYVGHPNGHVGWTRDLEVAGSATLVWPGGEMRQFRAERLQSGAERSSVILATGQHPFPANLVYRLGRAHIRAVGVYFRLEPIERQDG
jgi:hypothetical protein